MFHNSKFQIIQRQTSITIVHGLFPYFLKQLQAMLGNCKYMEKPSTTVRIFGRNNYYTLHGEDATFVITIIPLQMKTYGGNIKLNYICLNKNQFESLLRELLLVRQYRVEVYVKSQSKNNDWHLEYKGSPGNFTQFEDILFENTQMNVTNTSMAIKIVQSKVLAISCANVIEGKFEVCEINYNETFSELEAVLAQISPKECIIPAGDSPELISLKTILERNNVLVAKVKRSDFVQDDLIQDLNRLLFFHEDQQRNAACYSETNMKEAMGCLQALIKFLNLMGDERNFNQFKISTFDIFRFVRLDNAALYALNVLPKTNLRGEGRSNLNQKTSSLKGLLDSCVTAQGHRLLEQWIKQPLKDYSLINDRLDIVEALVTDSETRTLLSKTFLPRIIDLIQLARKISCKKAKLQDCYRIYQTVNCLPAMVNVLTNIRNSSAKAMIIEPISEAVAELKNYQTMIEQTLDLDLVDRGEYLVKCTFDDELKEMQDDKDKISEKMQRLLQSVKDDLGFSDGKSGVKLECNDQHGYFFRVTLKDEKPLRKNKKYKIIDAIKGGVRFTSDKLTDLNEAYRTINENYKARQKAVCDEIFEVAAGYADTLRNLNVCLATVDVLVSFATAAISAHIPYARPKLHKDGTGILKIKKLRHPCLEAQDRISFIPNDVNLSKDGKTLNVITGPNMCGKSTYIRSVGMCVLMAHIGSMVPCQTADISLVDAILVRVGAEDCQLKGISTFMMEMIETTSIITNATKNSLVIIDELGRGTSTYDGCGIAYAIAEHLAEEIKCFTLFATHFHEINSLSETCNNVGNLHVSAVIGEDTITPLYQIRDGECDESFGFHCARLAGFPEDVVQDALEYHKKLEHRKGLKYISNFEPSLKRKIIREGYDIIKSSLVKLTAKDIDKMSDDELTEAIAAMKSDLESNENLFVKGLLTSDD